MKNCLRPLLSVFLFVAIQGVTSIFVMFLIVLVCMCQKASQTGVGIFTAASFPDELPQVSVGEMATIMLVSGIVTLWVLAKPVRSLRWPKALSARDVHWRVVPLALLAFVLGVLAVNLFCECLDLPDWVGDDLAGLMDTLPGVLAVGVVGPLVEEAVFREALLGGMLLEKVSPWKAILISSLVFGAIHFNPAQVPAAFAIGVMLGVVYWRTGNIVLPWLLHMANNLFCVGQTWVLGDSARNFSLSNWMGGAPVSMVVLAVSLLLCVGLFIAFVRSYPVVETPETCDDDIKYA